MFKCGKIRNVSERVRETCVCNVPSNRANMKQIHAPQKPIESAELCTHTHVLHSLSSSI